MIHIRRVTYWWAVAATIVWPTVSVADWSSLRFALDDAKDKLQKVAKSSDFEEAKDYARRAKNALDDASIAASDINCPAAYSELDDAARRARRARDAGDVEEFSDEYRQAVRGYNDAVAYLQQCARRRQ